MCTNQTCSLAFHLVIHTCLVTPATVLPLQVVSVLHLLLRLEQDESWEVRHGGLLGVMYLVGTRADLTERLLPTLLPIITKGLQVCSPPLHSSSPLLLPHMHILTQHTQPQQPKP